MSKDNIRSTGAVLLIGGEGKRLRSLTAQSETGEVILKPLLPIAGREMVLYTLDQLKPPVVQHLVFAVHHNADTVKTWVENIDLPQRRISYSTQNAPGVLDAITSGATHVTEDSFVTATTDTIRYGLDLQRALNFHQSSGRLATMVAGYTNNLSREMLLTVNDTNGLVTRTEEYPSRYTNKPDEYGSVHTGFVILDQGALEFFDPAHDPGMNGVIDPLRDANQLGAFVDPNIVYFNVNTPNQYKEAEVYLAAQVVSKRSEYSNVAFI